MHQVMLSANRKKRSLKLYQAITKASLKNGIKIINGEKQARLASGVFPFVTITRLTERRDDRQQRKKRWFAVARFVRGRRGNRAIIKTLNLTSS